MTVDFGEQGTLYVALDDRGSWTMDTAKLKEGGELRRRLETFQSQVSTEMQHVLEQQALMAKKKAQSA
jgi:hypothetical protein